MSRRVKIQLHGPLRELYPEAFEIEADTAAEAINGFCKQTGVFNVSPFESKYCINVVGFDSKEALYSPLGPEITTLNLIPHIAGGKSGFVKIIIAAALIAVSFIPGLNVAIWSGYATTWSSLALSMGVSMLLGGLLELISPVPKLNTNTTQDVEASKYLGANQNTVKIGTRIPILYGRHIAYGHYISFDVDAKDVAV